MLQQVRYVVILLLYVFLQVFLQGEEKRQKTVIRKI
jgi:hypothetical protein